MLEEIGRLRHHARYQECWELIAYELSKRGLTVDSVNLPKHQRSDAYIIYYNLSIIASYLGKKTLGLRLCDRLLFSHLEKYLTPGATIRNTIISNLKFYISSLPWSGSKPVPFDPPVIDGTAEKWRTLNPSIIPYAGGYLINCRCVNFNNDRCLSYKAVDGGPVKTRNFLLRVNTNMELLSSIELIDRSGLPIWRDQVLGLEDIQLVRVTNRVYFVCSTYYTHPSKVLCCLGLIPSEALGATPSPTVGVTQVVPMNYHSPITCEKNWLSMVYQGKLTFVYHCNPLTLIRPKLDSSGWLAEENTVELLKIPEHPSPPFRGSGGPVDYRGGYLIVVHEVDYGNGSTGRTYYHRLLHYTGEWKLESVSQPFYFDRVGIEYCRSMCWSLDEQQLIFGVGIRDSQAMLYYLNRSELERLLHPLQCY